MSNLSREVLPSPISSPSIQSNFGTHYYTPENRFYIPASRWTVIGDGWTYCREEFHRRFNQRKRKPKGFYFGTNKATTVARMFRWVEERLNVSQNMRTIVYRCESLNSSRNCIPHQNLSVIYLDLSPFWLSENTRTYFVSIMVRSAHRYQGLPLSQLLSSPYCQDTARATALFLAGYTLSEVTRHTGWVSRFGTYDNRRLRKIRLKRPTKKADCKYFEAGDSCSCLTQAERSRLAEWIQQEERIVGVKRALPEFFQKK